MAGSLFHLPFRCFGVPVWLITANTLLAEPARLWTDASGNKSFQAELISRTPQTATLLRPDGRLFALTSSSLSAGDQQYLASLTPATPVRRPRFDRRPSSSMLEGYTETSLNFNDPWPTDSGEIPETLAKPIREEAGRGIYESLHFRIQSDALLSAEARNGLARLLEAIYHGHQKLPLQNRRTRSSKAPKLGIQLFSTQAAYQAAAPPGTAGVYLQSPDQLLVPFESAGIRVVANRQLFLPETDFHVMLHEATHLLWADIGNDMDVWLSEGMAEYLGCAHYRPGRLFLNRLKEDTLLFATAHGVPGSLGGRALGKEIEMPHLEKFMNYSRTEFLRDPGANYGRALLLVRYFFHDHSPNASRLKASFKAMQDGADSNRARSVLLGAQSYESLEASFTEAMKRDGIQIRFF